ncbi:antirestriction protein [Burkholderia glumae]|uniref:antirestriction protein n=1 Tax=Burkholderia glumae TaxID=337 RepID=UPI0020CBAF03|nr:antirestriction protein [Burkholderia glumae]MCQ0031443.1 antirestriction protein [Burkholderia glumae]MCQ0035095.1 antirestriction protein [Burkholderia glumae]UVT00037.1 antirestriction protein [Burkholderia glumae]
MSSTNRAPDLLSWKIDGALRMNFLPGLFGPYFVRVEAMSAAWAGKLSPDYDGGYWEFFRISNGGGFLAPASERQFRVLVDTNGYEGAMSAGAFGIVVTLFALCYIAQITQSDLIASRYHELRDFASGHPEAREIFRAID